MGVATIVAVLTLVVVGAAAQRTAGLGFALLVSPLMTLVIGGHEGVLLVNFLGFASSSLILSRVWRDIDWSILRWLAAFSVIGAAFGAWLSLQFSADVMAIAVGAVVLVALGSSVAVRGNRITTEARAPRAIGGLLSGATSALAGVGGPAVSAYAVLTKWPQTSFVATLQPYFMLSSAASITSKLVLDPSGLPRLDGWMWPLILVAMVAGIGAGELLLKRVTASQVRRFVVVIAFAGALASLVRGIVGVIV